MDINQSLLDDLKVKIKNFELEVFESKIIESSKESIAIYCELESENGINSAMSKFGGNPYVSEAFDWPKNGDRYLSFVAQINLEELKAQAATERLPECGLLSFFYDGEGGAYSKTEKDSFRVFYFSKDEIANLKSIEPPVVPPKKVFFGLFTRDDSVKVYRACSLKFKKFLSLPSDFDTPETLGMKEDSDFDQYFEMIESMGNHHRLLGHCEPIQSPMELDCELVASGINVGFKVDIEEEEELKYKEAAKQWNLLLQLDSDNKNTDMLWGDGGRLYFWIKDSDLEKKDFSNCWMFSQCH